MAREELSNKGEYEEKVYDLIYKPYFNHKKEEAKERIACLERDIRQGKFKDPIKPLNYFVKELDNILAQDQKNEFKNTSLQDRELMKVGPYDVCWETTEVEDRDSKYYICTNDNERTIDKVLLYHHELYNNELVVTKLEVIEHLIEKNAET